MKTNTFKFKFMKTNTFKDIAILMYKGKVNNPLYDVIGEEGNTKVPCTTAIFNMSSAKDCPSLKLGLCKAIKQGAKCYARKAENMYDLALPYRRRQHKYWKHITAEEFACQFLLLNSCKIRRFKALRFNESGDFHSQECLNKAEKIARILKSYGIVTYCYTSRSDLDFSGVRDLVIHGSGFIKNGIKGIFTIVNRKQDKLRGFSLCKMDCRVCNLCLKSSKVCVVKH